MDILDRDHLGLAQMRQAAADGFRGQSQEIRDIRAAHRQGHLTVRADILAHPLGEHAQERCHPFHRGFPPQHHEVILHRADFAQRGVHQALVEIRIAVALFQRAAAIGLQRPIHQDIAIGVMQTS